VVIMASRSVAGRSDTLNPEYSVEKVLDVNITGCGPPH
jgi:hypothetical protein